MNPLHVRPCDPRQNQLLATLSDLEWHRWRPHLQRVDLSLGQVLCASGRSPSYVIFPTTAIVSLLYLTLNGASAEVAVVGVPHETWGETPRAYVVREAGQNPSEAELIAFTRERLARFKCPTSIMFVDALPRNASGKILKRDLRS